MRSIEMKRNEWDNVFFFQQKVVKLDGRSPQKKTLIQPKTNLSYRISQT